MIHVEVQTIGGRSAEYDIVGDETVLGLKWRLVEDFKVPWLCQTLLLEGEDLKDEHLLESLGQDELSLTLVVSTEKMYAQLQDRNQDWTQAIQALDVLDPTDEHVVGVLIEVLGCWAGYQGRGRRLRRQKVEVGQIASKMLVRLSVKEHAGAYDALDDCLGSYIYRVRTFARKALLKDELRGNATLAACAVRRGLKPRRGEPREGRFVRLQVMGHLVTEDNAEVRKTAVTLLESDVELKVKISVCKHLAHVLRAGGEPTSHAVSKALCQTFLDDMRRYAWSDLARHLKAVREMAVFSARNDPETMRRCLRLLSTSRDSSRIAVEILCNTTDRGVSGAVDALCESVRTGFESFERAAAAEALGHLASPGDEQVLACLCDAVKDTAEVAQSATTACPGVAGRGHQGALKVVKSLLEHKDGWVRAVAPGALVSLVAPGEEAEVVEALVRLAKTPSSYSEAKEAALKALGDLCPTACSGALEAAGAVVRSGDRQLSRTAVKLLSRVAVSEPYTEKAMAALIEAAVPVSFLDEDETLQTEVAKVLMGLAKEEGPSQEAARKTLEGLSQTRLAHPALMASMALKFLNGEGSEPFLSSGPEDTDTESGSE